MSEISRKAAEELAISFTKTLLEKEPNLVLANCRYEKVPEKVAKFIKDLAGELQKNLTTPPVEGVVL